MLSASARAASRMRSKARSLRSTCATSRLIATSRIADWAGSSASAAWVSKLKPSTGGIPATLPGTTIRPGMTPATKPRRAIDGVAERLSFHHKLGVFNLVECARAVGQLHTGLKQRIALARQRHLPTLSGLIKPFDGKRLAASPSRWRHGGQRGIARDQALQRNRRDDINQGVHGGAFFQQRQWKTRHIKRGCIQPGFNTRTDPGFNVGSIAGIVGCSLARLVLARRPSRVCGHGRQYQAAQNGQTNLQITHDHQASSAIEMAASISTATMRDTPCSCIVTPISCLAISMAILLWLMNRNWVSLLMLDTSLA